MLVWGLAWDVDAETPRIVGIVPRRAFLSKPRHGPVQRVQQKVVGPEGAAAPVAAPAPEGVQVPASRVAVAFNSTPVTVGIGVHELA
jgi:hypothetical protein